MIIDYQIILMDDMKVQEAVVPNSDDSYTIFINRNLCEEKQREAVNHALYHIENDDFSASDVQEIELNAHKKKGENHGT